MNAGQRLFTVIPSRSQAWKLLRGFPLLAGRGNGSKASVHLGIHLFPEVREALRVVLQGEVRRILGVPLRDRNGASIDTESNEDDDAVSGAPPLGALGIGGVDIDRNVQAAAPASNHQCPKLNQLSDMDRSQEVEAANIHSDTIRSRPSSGAGVPCLIDPLHDRAAVYLAPEVDIAGLGEKPQGDASLALHRGQTLIAMIWICAVSALRFE
jgi:hypothetical protein